MPTIQTDRRLIEAEPDPEGERRAAAIAAEYLDVRLRFARALLRIERGRTYALSACASIVQYAVRLGVPANEARALVDLGRALEAPVPAGDVAADAGAEGGARGSVEERIRSGHLAVENAAVAGRLLAEPGLLRPGEDWLRQAETLRPSELRREVQARVEAVAQRTTALLPITLHVTERVRDEFHRARSLVSREAQFMLTEGQAFARIVRFYLDCEDELRDGRGVGGHVGADDGAATRAPAGCRTRSRYVQASARRAVLSRSGDRCEVPGCPHDTFLELAHIEPHARGGTTDARNLLRLCHAHHTQLDAGVLVFTGWTDASGGCRPGFRPCNGAGSPAGARSESGAGDGAGIDVASGAREDVAGDEDDEAPAPGFALDEFEPWDDREAEDAEALDGDPRPPSRSRRRSDWNADRDRGAWFVSEAVPPPWGGAPDVGARRTRREAGERLQRRGAPSRTRVCVPSVRTGAPSGRPP